MSDVKRTLEWERRWAVWAGVSAIAAAFFFVAYFVLLRSLPHGDFDADFLRQIDDHRAQSVVSGGVELLGVLCLIFPLVYLFRAADARMPAVRSRLLPAVIIAPLLFGLAGFMQPILLNSAATDFLGGTIPSNPHAANELASDTVSQQSLRPFVAGLYFGGGIGMAVVMFYICLYSMRAGLLARFWGSLGMATGFLTFLFGPFPFAMIWFAYLGLLMLDRLPGKRPPAWEAGKAVPWLTPGERMAKQMDPRGKPGDGPGDGEVIDEAPKDDAPADADSGTGPVSAAGLGGNPDVNPARKRGERRKRKGN